MNHLLSTANTTETANIAENISTSVNAAALTDDYLNSASAALQSNANTMIQGIGTTRRKELTKEVDAADNLRDDLLSALNSLLKGYMYWNNPSTTEAATTLYAIIKDHGTNINKYSYEKQTAVLDSLLKRFEDHSNDLAAVNLTALIEELNTAQNNFKSLFQQSAKLESTKVTVAPSNIKMEVITQINKIADFLVVMTDVNQSVYGELKTNVEQLIDDLNSKIRARRSSGKSADEADN